MPSKKQSTGEEYYPPLPLIGKWFEKATPSLKTRLKESHHERITGFLVKLSHYLLYISALCGFAIGLYATIKLGYVKFALVGTGFLLFLPTVQYMSNKFLNSNEVLLKQTPSQISSTLVPHLVSLVSLVASVILGVIYIIDAVSLEHVQYGYIGFSILLVGWSVAILAMRTESLYMIIDPETSAGGEALGIISLLVRILYRLVPLFFSLLVIFWSVNLIIDVYTVFIDAGNIIGNTAFAQDNANWLLLSTALPIAAYLAFSLIYLSIDVLRAILSMRKDR